jgi:Domain of unknown function (DUF4404)
MDKNSLRDHLAKLRGDLTAAPQADAATKQSLNDALQDIHRMIDTTDAAAAQDSTLPERLERIAVQFEAGHPTLAASARRLVDLLGEVGI